MKKTLLALVVAAAATSVNAAEIYKSEDGSVNFYGQLRTELKFSEDSDGDWNEDLSSGSSRMGIDGSYALTDSLDVLGLVEVGVRDNTDVNVRQHIFGFSGDFGTIKLGKQWTTSDDVYGADYSYFYGGSALRYSTLNGALHDSQIKYAYDAEQFWLKAGWGLNEGESNQDLYELFVGTSFDALDLHAGVGLNKDYAFGEDDDAGVDGAEVENLFFELTAEYNIGDHLIGFTYYNAELSNGNGSEKIKENGYSLAGIYQATAKTALYAGYEFTDQESSGFAMNYDEDGTVIYVGVEHKFNSWSRVYAEYGYGDGTTLGYSNKGSDQEVEAQVADSESNFGIGARFYW
ncbi:porin [Vibrio agarivorans]|uniref:porin n=1 Tax=Vibrio agarivorans TaxID=153622 RepID=UPI00222ED430|nr:porin [Vibrio agarivorans]MDN3662925.1 porin [Vibrio agarivorans]